MKKYLLEGIGTALLVLIACGVASVTGADVVATSLSFGIVLFSLVLVIGPATGAHVNPAVSFALAISKKITWKEFAFYVIAQFVGGLVGSLVLWLIIGTSGTGANSTQPILNGAIYNGGSLVPDWAAWVRALVVECALTFVFVGTILVVTTKYKNKLLIALSIGLSLTVVHLIGIRLTGTSVNPARSFGPAIFAIIGGDLTPITQYVIFLVGPLGGAALAAVTFKSFTKKPETCECTEGDKCCCEEHHSEEHCEHHHEEHSQSQEEVKTEEKA
ncbi:MAG: aquaporin [Acholeplasmatales bacterium]|jgi:aquaporin Z|nr:aquaporin [Acholeplasmatales bacterium]